MPLIHSPSHYTLEPSAERAACFDSIMRSRLADSLAYVLDVAEEALETDAAQATALISRIRKERQSPDSFGLYYGIVVALEAGEIEQARGLAEELLSLPPCTGFNILALPDEPPHRRTRLRETLISGYDESSDTCAELVRGAAPGIENGLQLLANGFPELEAEIRALICDLILGADADVPGARTFNGASAFQLWGAVLLNARNVDRPLYTALSLAHESGHNLLFGYCTHESLVLNPDEELYKSPLRVDPRPMDGIFHATYVSARMHLAAARLIASGALTPEDEATAADLMRQYEQGFEQGYAVVREHGQLTDTGEAVIAGARAYMDANASAPLEALSAA